MLFNSFTFIFLFLPATLLGYYILGRFENRRLAMAWLVFASLFFYGWWKWEYLILIVLSMLFNYKIGVLLCQKAFHKATLVSGVVVNLLLLGYFKYANFFIDNLNRLAGTTVYIDKIVLPLAISFFTFQQVAFLVDAYRKETRELNFLDYCLFVSFFPQLIAGPIVHHKEMLPQFQEKEIFKFNSANFIIGVTIFALGLFKKTILADGIAPYGNAVFASAEAGNTIGIIEAWAGTLAYTFQLYFDFSGYTDMALGAARLFGIILPLNFFSPYKATSIIEFWRRWHITLSRFLRDYLYIPLGGNRKGPGRRYVNLMFTMLIGGLWHGAGWNFVIWGGLHGLFLIINHLWHSVKKSKENIKSSITDCFNWGITFLSVSVAWVFFRAETFTSASQIFKGLLGFNGLKPGHSTMGSFNYTGNNSGILLLVVLLFISLALPNTQQFLKKQNVTLETDYTESKLQWQPDWRHAVFMGIVSAVAFFGLTQVSEFLYFNF